jgi:hypothetical protein
MGAGSGHLKRDDRGEPARQPQVEAPAVSNEDKERFLQACCRGDIADVEVQTAISLLLQLLNHVGFQRCS